MLSDFILLAQATDSAQLADSTQFKFVGLLAVLLLGIGLPIFLGQLIAKRLRMAEIGWRIGLILCVIILSSLVVGRSYDRETGQFNIKLGVDLKGGVILIYEVDESATAAANDPDSPDGSTGRVNMGALVEAIARRINPSGTKEIVIRPYGDQQVEVIVPEVDQREVELIKKSISTAGVLQFRIVANSRDHADIIELAREAALDLAKKRGRFIRDEAGNQVGLWARVGRDQAEGGGGTFKLSVASNTIRDAATGDILEVDPAHFGDRELEFTRYIKSLGIEEIDVLMETNDPYNVTGNHLGAVSRGNDERLRPCIMFNLKQSSGGVGRFADLTTDYGPEGNFNRQLGIILDNTLLSAPNIQEPITQGRGRITGEFTAEEVDFMVNILEAGSLPVVLNPIPISENQINPLLGKETIQQGKMAMLISLAIVLVFILFYYRFSGFVACLALVLNLLFILAIMILIKAAFTLPGLAGLVLTVGMSVDANVLIFERIREEMSRGAALRMAIRNGFARATTTIIDANVTTLITAFVLYGIGTDQIRGFAVTLILGILMSMFTAIFCSRVAFDIAERTRWLKKLSMMQILSATQIDFIGKRKLAGACSILVIIVGLFGIAGRGASIFDIDFRGGTSVQMRLKSSAETESVREKLAAQFSGAGTQFSVTAMNNTAGAMKNDTFKVDSDIDEVIDLENAIHDAFAGPDGKSELATYSLEYGPLRPVALIAPATTEKKPATPVVEEAPAESASETPGATEEPTPPVSEATTDAAEEEKASPEKSDSEPAPENDKPEAASENKEPEAATDADQGSSLASPAGTLLAYADDARELLLAQVDTSTDAAPADTASTDEATDTEATTTPEPEADAPAESSDNETDAISAVPIASAQTEVDLTFGYGINAQTLTGEIEAATQELNLPVSHFQLVNQKWDGSSSNAFESWKLLISADETQTKQLLEHLKAKFADSPVWSSSSKIGGQVAGDMQQKAIAALVASLFGIVLYIWIRFQRVIFGLAAVVALLHDVLVTLGAIALSAWLADALGFLLIEEFKISLPIVAALLTIIGYSLNDTIVVFDRIREVRGKSPSLTGDMINTSINQTLSRTMLTSLTTLIVVIILYAIGGDGIHGFAFSLVVGVVVGTYSSIFVASPVLLWMTSANQKSTAGKAKAAAGNVSASA
ncbi:MAG: protein translocase subunit SecD [Planctomycetaceae bacterium]|nr:protein translocase subunit SecD [Planctomycetales bacterium]MCB9874049.1 protein translocase subunit SecD [Planctomycetaceae bacterium]MCB9937697.1 protein translocase subunit SecD [Planctomycetaceae bacterium]